MWHIAKQNPKNTFVEDDHQKRYTLNTYTYEALSKEPNDPLFCVSVSNNSFSVDVWRGCTLDCAYCHVQGCFYDLQSPKGELSTNYVPIRRNNCTIDSIVEAICKNFSFIPNYSVISICSSSTEPFLNDQIIDSTIEIMEAFAKRNLKNPFWIITKIGGLDAKWKPRLTRILENGNPMVLSVCWTNNLKEIEPMQKSRLENLMWMAESGVQLNWYLRPLVDEWNASTENLRYMMQLVKEKGIPFVNVIAGGLRWTEGIEFGLSGLHHLQLPKLLKENDTKTLFAPTMERLKAAHQEYLPNIPLFFKSSCGLSHALGIANLNCLQFEDKRFCGTCVKEQESLCAEVLAKIQVEQLNEQLQAYDAKVKVLHGSYHIDAKDKKTYTYAQKIISSSILQWTGVKMHVGETSCK